VKNRSDPTDFNFLNIYIISGDRAFLGIFCVYVIGFVS